MAGAIHQRGTQSGLLVPLRDGKDRKLVSDAFVLGMFDSSRYQSRPLHLCGGDILVVYSDGLTDAQNQQDEMFGELDITTVQEASNSRQEAHPEEGDGNS